jgi:dynein heavy chain
MHMFVSSTLGPAFADPPAAKLADLHADSSAATPLVLTVAQGADAMAELGAFAAAQGRAVGRGLQLLSLGQGQGPVAEAVVRVCMRNGDWVCIQVSI